MRKKAVIDTNLLLLLTVGLADKSLIEKHKRCNIFAESDFDLLSALLGESSEILLTPNTLTETSNLAAQIAEPAKTRVMESLRVVISRLNEITVRSTDASNDDIFIRLGLTDAALMRLARENVVILTTDFDLYMAALNAGCDVINFTHHIAANR